MVARAGLAPSHGQHPEQTVWVPVNRHWSDPPSCYWLRAHSRGLLVEGSVFNSGVGGGRKEEAVRWVMGCRGLLLCLPDAWS